MKVYYAHSLHLYNTPQELRDVDTLLDLGFTVLNPNTPETQIEYEKSCKEAGVKTMKYFEYLINQADCIAFRPFIDGKIGSGVGYEVKYARDTNKPVFELPNLNKGRFLELDETREYLALHGQR